MCFYLLKVCGGKTGKNKNFFRSPHRSFSFSVVNTKKLYPACAFWLGFVVREEHKKKRQKSENNFMLYGTFCLINLKFKNEFSWILNWIFFDLIFCVNESYWFKKNCNKKCVSNFFLDLFCRRYRRGQKFDIKRKGHRNGYRRSLTCRVRG